MTAPPLFLVRHAPTRANAEGLVLGAGDSPILPGGFDAARRLAATLAGRGIRRIFSSPLGRAVDTAAVLAEVLALQVEVLPGLAELSCGAWEGLPRRLARPEGGPLRASWTDRPPGGESYADAEPRVAAALAGLADGPALAVGHCVLHRVVLALAAGLPPERLLGFVHAHGQVLALGPGLSWFDASGRSGPGLPPGPAGDRA